MNRKIRTFFCWFGFHKFLDYHWVHQVTGMKHVSHDFRACFICGQMRMHVERLPKATVTNIKERA